MHAGFIPALLAFIMFWLVIAFLSLWWKKPVLTASEVSSLPGAVGMYGFSLGVSAMNDALPRPVYALLCGLNSATVGIIALAAVQLGHRAITDKLSRALVFLGATAGMLYNALWYFPVLMVAAGAVTIAWDLKLGPRLVLSAKGWVKDYFHRQTREEAAVEEGHDDTMWTPSVAPTSEPASAFRRVGTTAQPINGLHRPSLDRENGSPLGNRHSEDVVNQERILPASNKINVFSLPVATAIVVGFSGSFIVILVARALLKHPPVGLSLFANLYLAGTVSQSSVYDSKISDLHGTLGGLESRYITRQLTIC